MMDSETEDNQTRIATAKTSFVQAVSEGIDALMKQCGYSRERATNTLVRELSRGDSPSTRPNDQEIFDLMSRYGLGIEEATRLIIVSRALRRAMQSAGSPSKAIQNLASKIAVTRLLYDSSEEETTSEDDMPIRPDFQFEPISPMERRTTRSTSRHHHARLSSRTNSTTTTPKKSRKRSVEEIVSSSLTEKQKDGPLLLSQQQRPRSESVSEEVSAKMAQQHHDQDTSMPSERKATPATVRAKRAATHRDDNNSDGALLTPTNKRQQRGPPATTADAGL